MPFKHLTVTIFKKSKAKQFKKHEYNVSVKIPGRGMNIELREVLNKALSERILIQEDRAVCIQDSSLGISFKSVIFIIDIILNWHLLAGILKN